jgi:hypothetical protein
MNIFYLDHKPSLAAAYHCDKHVVKMILETAQLLCTAHRVLDDRGPLYYDDQGYYKSTHVNHPSAIWVRSSVPAYMWTHALLLCLCEEYTRRYGKVHKVESSGLMAKLVDPPGILHNTKPTFPPQCMPEQYKRDDVVEAYRAYYVGEKHKIAKWRTGKKPTWWVDSVPESEIYRPVES